MCAEQNLPPELARLSAFIHSHIECLAGSSSELCSIALCATKHTFDWALGTEVSSRPHVEKLLATLTETAPPQTRSRARSTSETQSPMHNRRKKLNIGETPLPSLFLEGMNADQIWQQLDLRAARVCDNLQVLQGENEFENLKGEDSDNDGSEDVDSDAEMDDDEDEDDDDENLWEGLSDEEEDDGSTAEGVIDLQDEISDDDEDRELLIPLLGTVQQKPRRAHSRGHLDLDDSFFNLATFNTETCEEKPKKRKRDFDSDDDSAKESEVDLFGSVDDLEANGMDDALFYKDFFDPPPGVQNRPSKVRFHERVSVKKIKAVGRGMPVSSMGDEDDEDEDEDEDD